MIFERFAIESYHVNMPVNFRDKPENRPVINLNCNVGTWKVGEVEEDGSRRRQSAKLRS
jgi:hypothetical protein